MNQYSVVFNGNDIRALPYTFLYNHNFNNLPNRDIKINKIARRDLSVITSSEYTSKEITVWLDICNGNRAGTEQAAQELKALLQQQNAPLKVLQAGLETEYVATMNEFNIQWDAAKAYVTIVFIASDPIGFVSQTESLTTMTGISTTTLSSSFFVYGTYKVRPFISITINSVTGGTSATMSVYNGRTNQGIIINSDFVAGDIITIDSQNMEATINGILTDFSGMFPEFPAGSQQLIYTDSFTARSVDLTATYNRRV